jgi:hypothetical protein
MAAMSASGMFAQLEGKFQAQVMKDMKGKDRGRGSEKPRPEPLNEEDLAEMERKVEEARHGGRTT